MAKWTNIQLQVPTSGVRLSARVGIFFFCLFVCFFLIERLEWEYFHKLITASKTNKQTNKQNKKRGAPLLGLAKSIY